MNPFSNLFFFYNDCVFLKKIIFLCNLKKYFINQKTALYHAINKENIEMVQFLLSLNNVDINKKSIKTKIMF